MEYESWKERLMRKANQFVWPPLCCIHPQIQLHRSATTPALYGQHSWNCLSSIMEIEEKQLYKGKGESWAILMKN
jgi:hypothetical protein